MCFTVNVNIIKEELENRYGATLIDPDKYRPSYYYHAFTLPELPVVCSDDTAKVQLFTWGLIPSWTKSIEEATFIRSKTFNARAETIRQKPSFSQSFKNRHCLIPVMGFFEWQHIGKEKIPWYIYHSENEIISLAGIYDEWIYSSTNEIFRTFSVITTEANELMAEIHNSGKRMPAILDKSAETAWLDTRISETEVFSLLKQYPSDKLKAHTIGPLVSDRSANKNTLEVIKPYARQQGNLFF